MALWGKSTTDESKPKYLIRGAQNHDPADCFADERGWVLRHYKQQGDKAAAVAAGEYWDEVLVAIGGLGGAGATDLLADANITAVFFEQEALAQGETGTVVVIYTNLSLLVVQQEILQSQLPPLVQQIRLLQIM